MKKKKFKIGDFVVRNASDVHSPMKIEKMNPEGYVCDNGFIGIDCESDYHKWTILDACQGDVLYNEESNSICIFAHFDGISDLTSSFVCYCGLEGFGLEQELNLNGFHDESNGYVPATSDQKQYLFEKIREAGYEWNAEGKKLVCTEKPFEVGDWIVNYWSNGVYQVVSCDEQGQYEIKSGDTIITKVKHILKNFHKWTISDAKDCDILVVKKNSQPFIFNGIIDAFGYPDGYCGLDDKGEFVYFGNDDSRETIWTYDDVCPATKTQAETLFEKMKQSGYEFDFNKKTVKKISSSESVLWSDEEDVAINKLEDLVVCLFSEKHAIEIDDMYCMVRWLQSLRERALNNNAEWTEKDEQISDSVVICLNRLQSEGNISHDEVMNFAYFLKNFKTVHCETNNKIEMEDKEENKIESKFKVGDWIYGSFSVLTKFGKDNISLLVTDVSNGYYSLLSTQDSDYHERIDIIDNNFRKWKITDARSGDIIIMKSVLGAERTDSAFIFYRIKNRSYAVACVEFYGWIDSDTNTFKENVKNKNYIGIVGNSVYVPATYQQRQQFNTKMYFAGYRFDDENLCLVKRDIESGDVLKNVKTGELYIRDKKGNNVDVNGKCVEVAGDELKIASEHDRDDFLDRFDKNGFFFDETTQLVRKKKMFSEGDSFDDIDEEFYQELGRIVAFWQLNHNGIGYEENELMEYVKVRGTKLVELARMKKPDYCHHEVELEGNSEEYRKAYYDGWNNCNQQHEQAKNDNKSLESFKKFVVALCKVVEKSLS